MLQPLSQAHWTPAAAAHLLARAGFGGTPEEIQALHARGLAGAVDALLAGSEDDDLFPPPPLTPPEELFRRAQEIRQAPDEPARQELQRKLRQEQDREIRQVRESWMERMRYTPFPLREKTTLFWHGHFATSVTKVRAPFLMAQQNETLRAGSLGSFRQLVKDISRDPAMMRYLDVVQSDRNKPNENFARELMELFTLGEGVRYTEDDIREAARAFTGYRLDREGGGFAFRAKAFDDGPKTFFGRTGKFNGDAIIDIILEQPECSEFLARKLWVFFASDRPSKEIVQQLAFTYRHTNYDTRAVLREMFLSAEFYSPRVVRQQVKSPVQWLVQSARVLEAPLPGGAALEGALSQMGQVPLAPPSVKGWEGGRAWISSSTLLFRCNFAGYLVSGKAPALDGIRKEAGPVRIPLDRLAPPALRGNPEGLCDALTFRLLNAPLAPGERERFVAFLRERGTSVNDAAVRDFLHLLMSTPDYQLT